MSEPPVLSIRGLERAYVTGDKTLKVLKGVDLDVRPGEVVGLIGPSGSGKSSLLHAAGLLEHPTAGKIEVNGVDCSALSERERTRVRLSQLGFVYQFHHLLPEFTALDNVALPIRIAGASQAEARKRAAALLGQLGLAERLDHQPGQLSGGEQQRVAIARALANRPRLVLADEPTGNLDPATSKAVFAPARPRAQPGRRRAGGDPQHGADAGDGAGLRPCRRPAPAARPFATATRERPMTTVWDPAQYERYKAYRDRPALDLMVQIPGGPRASRDLGYRLRDRGARRPAEAPPPGRRGAWPELQRRDAGERAGAAGRCRLGGGLVRGLVAARRSRT